MRLVEQSLEHVPKPPQGHDASKPFSETHERAKNLIRNEWPAIDNTAAKEEVNAGSSPPLLRQISLAPA